MVFSFDHTLVLFCFSTTMFGIASFFIKLVLAFVPITEYIWGEFNRWKDAVKILVDFLGWISCLFRKKDEKIYMVGYDSIKISTLVTGSSVKVSDWCRNFSGDFLDEVDRPCAISLFDPRIHNPKKKFCKYNYLVVFFTPDHCLVFKIDRTTVIPFHLRNLLENENFIIFVESIKQLKVFVRHHTPHTSLRPENRWKIPKTFVNLPILLRRSTDGFESLKEAVESLDGFTYKVPSGILTSNWEKDVLSYQQVEFLTMRSYSAVLLAWKNHITRWPLCVNHLLEDEAWSEDSDTVSRGSVQDTMSNGGVQDTMSNGGVQDTVSNGGVQDTVSNGSVQDTVSNGSVQDVFGFYSPRPRSKSL